MGALIDRSLTADSDETATEYLNNLDRMIRIYQAGLKVEPDAFKAYHNLGFIQMMAHQLDERGGTEQAIQYYRRGLLIQPNDFVTRANLGVALMHQGEIDAAITELRSAISLNPTSAEAHFNLSSLLLLSGNYQEGCGTRVAIRSGIFEP